MSVPKALTIAGSDSGGGAGIQADLKTFSALGVYGTSVITAITAQNTKTVASVFPLPTDLVTSQLATVLEDIPIDVIKTGMLATREIVSAIASILRIHTAIPLVVDPVMVAKSGDTLLHADALNCLRKELLPMATVLTPNVPEAEVLTGMTLARESDYRLAAEILRGWGAKNIIIKGGHRPDYSDGAGTDVIDLFYDGTSFQMIRGPRIDTVHTHGTGCTFSAGIASYLAWGCSPLDASRKSRQYLTGALQKAYVVGGGKSPVHHFHNWWR